MAAKAGGEEAFHRGFADLARVGALRAGMIVADANGQYRDAGILRINALERSTGPVADPDAESSFAVLVARSSVAGPVAAPSFSRYPIR